MSGTPTIRCSSRVITNHGMIRQDLRQHAPAMRNMLSGTFAHPITNEKNAMQGVSASVSSNSWNIASLLGRISGNNISYYLISNVIFSNFKNFLINLFVLHREI